MGIVSQLSSGNWELETASKKSNYRWVLKCNDETLCFIQSNNDFNAKLIENSKSLIEQHLNTYIELQKQALKSSDFSIRSSGIRAKIIEYIYPYFGKKKEVMRSWLEDISKVDEIDKISIL